MNKRAIFKKKMESENDQSSDAFENDALDGFHENGVKLSSLKSLDKKFRPTNNSIWVFSSLILFFGVITFFILSKNQTKEISNKQIATNTKSIQIEKTDVLIPQLIDDLKPLETKLSIQPKTLKANFKARKQASENLKDENIKFLETPKLEPKKLNPLQQNDNTILYTNSKKGVEIYISALLTVDYRKYRSKPSINAESAIVTGTSANLENKSSQDVESSEWKIIEIPYYDYISKTMNLFSKGNYKKALSRYEEILKNYPDDINALFYGALCYYNLGENQKALDFFQHCVNHKFNNFEEDATWYEAKCLISMKKPEEALKILKEISAKNGFYNSEARKLISNL